MEEVRKEEAIKEVTEKVDEISKLDEINELIKNNEAEFEYDGQKYRVRRATFKEKQEVYKKRVEKYTELLRNEKYLLEADLKQLYLKRNIYIDAMDRQATKLAQDRENLMMKLGQLLKDKAPEDDLKTLKDEIQKLNSEIQEIFIKKNTLLEFSLENQVLVYSYTYLTYLITEKKVNDVWVKVWNNYDDYEKASEKLINMASYFATLMGNIEAEL